MFRYIFRGFGKVVPALVLVLLCVLSVAVPAQADVYFPHADAVQQWGWNTDLCLINLGASSVSGALKGYDDSGNLVAGPTSVTLTPHQRRVWSVHDTFPSFESGYFVFSTNDQDLVGYTKFFLNSIQRVAIPAVTRINQGVLYLPHMDTDSIWWTGIALVNTTAQAKNVQVVFPNGTTKSIALPAHGHKSMTIASLFGGSVPASLAKGTAEIRNAAGVIGLELFGQNPDAPAVVAGMKNNYLEGIPLRSDSSPVLYLSEILNNNDWWTGIVSYNPTQSAATATVTGYGAGGASVGQKQINIPAGGKSVATVTDLGLPSTTSWIKVVSNTPLSGFELLGAWSGENLGGLYGVDQPIEFGVLPNIDASNANATIYNLVNTGSSTASVTLVAYNNAGQVVAQKQLSIAPSGKYRATPANLFAPSAVTGATYVTMSSSQPLVACQLNFTNGRMFDVLPAIEPSVDPVQDSLDLLLGLSSDPDNQDILSELGTILGEAFGDGGGTCPTVTRTPDVLDIDNLPSTLTFVVNYGGGCTTTSGDAMSGSVTLSVTNLVMDGFTASARSYGRALTYQEAARAATGEVSADMALTATNVKRNGEVLMNGALNADFSLFVTDAGVITSASASMSSNHFVVAEQPILGSIGLTASNVDITGGSIGQVQIMADNFWLGGSQVGDGTITASGSQADLNVDVNMTTDKTGPVDMSLKMTTQGDVTTLNTTSPGVAGPYTVTVQNVTQNKAAACPENPQSGKVILQETGTDKVTTVTFTGNCNDPYTISHTGDDSGGGGGEGSGLDLLWGSWHYTYTLPSQGTFERYYTFDEQTNSTNNEGVPVLLGTDDQTARRDTTGTYYPSTGHYAILSQIDNTFWRYYNYSLAGDGVTVTNGLYCQMDPDTLLCTTDPFEMSGMKTADLIYFAPTVQSEAAALGVRTADAPSAAEMARREELARALQ